MNTHSMMPEKVALPLSSGQTAKTQSLIRLPDVMLEEGAERLGVAGLLYSVTFFFAFFGTNILPAISAQYVSRMVLCVLVLFIVYLMVFKPTLWG